MKDEVSFIGYVVSQSVPKRKKWERIRVLRICLEDCCEGVGGSEIRSCSFSMGLWCSTTVGVLLTT